MGCNLDLFRSSFPLSRLLPRVIWRDESDWHDARETASQYGCIEHRDPYVIVFKCTFSRACTCDSVSSYATGEIYTAARRGSQVPPPPLREVRLPSDYHCSINLFNSQSFVPIFPSLYIVYTLPQKSRTCAIISPIWNSVFLITNVSEALDGFRFV